MMRLYSLYTPSHQALLDEWFLKSLPESFELVIQSLPQLCSSARYMEQGWVGTTIHKVDLMLRAIEECWGDLFLYSDVDVQFFAPIQKRLILELGDRDMVGQRNNPAGSLCSGFFICRANRTTRGLFRRVKRSMHQKKSDQRSINQTLKTMPEVKWGLLPETFYGGGTLTGKRWSPDQYLPVPQNVLIHHANWCTGVEHKIAQLRYVRQIVQQRKLSGRVPNPADGPK